ncbi:hypothetical protein DFJ74DRAFT_700402 [Hyaloraphidium curvatum]|nr:hypothetical protein DFJ74DRAFT_700402 [Hyaloraphidium curvatum]
MDQTTGGAGDAEAELAFLRAEVTRLTSETAALAAENSSLRGRLQPHADDASRDSADAEGPTLPPELVMKIGELLPPRSKTLLRLASACRTHWQLLRPRLFEKLHARHLVRSRLLDPDRGFPDKTCCELMRELAELCAFDCVDPCEVRDEAKLFVDESVVPTTSAFFVDLPARDEIVDYTLGTVEISGADPAHLSRIRWSLGHFRGFLWLVPRLPAFHDVDEGNAAAVVRELLFWAGTFVSAMWRASWNWRGAGWTGPTSVFVLEGLAPLKLR